jgi:hypothetical protein
MNNPNKKTFSPFENAFKKHKNIVLAIPVILLALIFAIYFTSEVPISDSLKTESVADTSIPGADTKPISDSKIKVATDYEMMTDENRNKQNEADAVNLSDINSPRYESPTYEDPDKKVIDKVNEMLVQMEHSSNKKKTTAPSYPVSNAIKKDPIDASKTIAEENTAYARESFNNFFSSRERNQVKVTSSEEKTDSFIYAAIDGDQFGIEDGQRVNLTLSKNALIKGKLFLKHTDVYAKVSFRRNRVEFYISNINQISMDLKAYDAQDGELGLNVNQSLVSEISSDVVSDAANDVNVGVVPLGNTLKNIFRRKQNVPKVDLLNNQKLILKL